MTAGRGSAGRGSAGAAGKWLCGARTVAAGPQTTPGRHQGRPHPRQLAPGHPAPASWPPGHPGHPTSAPE